MKIKFLVLLVVAAVAVGVILSTFADASVYADFKQARNAPDREFHIIGTLDTARAIVYDPASPNYMSFYLTDDKGETLLVEYYNAKPQDFEKSEKVVITGKIQGDRFVAGSLLLKCPSKYNEDDTPAAFTQKKY